MSSSLCKTSVFKAYQDVINDVISNAREHFIEDGVDETILQELKQTWQMKLSATKAVEESREAEKVIGVNKGPKPEYNNGTSYIKNPHQTIQQQQMQLQHQHILNNKQVVGQVAPNNHMPQGQMGQAFPEWRRVPIQLTIPSAPGSGEGHRILSIDVPEVFLQGHHLKSILTGQVISTTMGLPLMTACAFLQDHVNAAFLSHQQSFFGMSNQSLIQPDMLHDDKAQTQRFHEIPQRDGPADSSDDDDDKSEDGSDNDIEDDKEEDMEEDSGTGAEEEPLNSEDDVSDAEGTEGSFETENVIVCQFDKITRSRNRWKFHLKDGIMNLNGEDYVFQKANGDAEW